MRYDPAITIKIKWYIVYIRVTHRHGQIRSDYLSKCVCVCVYTVIEIHVGHFAFLPQFTPKCACATVRSNTSPFFVIVKSNI